MIKDKEREMTILIDMRLNKNVPIIYLRSKQSGEIIFQYLSSVVKKWQKNGDITCMDCYQTHTELSQFDIFATELQHI